MTQQRYIDARRAVIARRFARMNDRQREAVLATEGPLLVLAGAGSGKTTVLINRVANLMKFGRASDSEELPPWANDEGLRAMEGYLAGDESLRPAAEAAAALDPVEPWRILAITFTNKAADELRSRLTAMLGDAAADIWARTFHSACVRILRRDADRLGYPKDFTIYDEQDRLSLLKRVMRDANVDEKQLPPKSVLATFDKLRDRMLSPERYAETLANVDVRGKRIARLYDEYTLRMFRAGAMDFEDLLYQTVRLLEGHEDVRERYRRQFRYVLIDEYQDTNNLQYRMAALLTNDRGNLCVVGDDDQSIYAFRGATIENILSFENRFTHCRTIRLEQNYRSTGHILAAANGVIANNRGRKGKNLWTEAGSGERVTLYVARNEDDEARYVVQHILHDASNGGALRDNAVLYRMNAQSRVLEQLFLRNGIRPRIVRGNPFFERAEIRDVMGYFFLVLNPADETRLRRIINMPPRGIGDKTVETVAMLAGQNQCPMFDILRRAREFAELGRSADKLEDFVAMIDSLRALAEGQDLEAFYDELLEKSGYVRMLREKRTEENLNRLENVMELKSFIRSHVKSSGDSTLAGFLDEVSLYTDLQNVDRDENTVTMMTIHAAKGLEFDNVYLVGAEEGLFPSLQAIGEAAQMEEERRLCYVAITRARKKLTVTCARQRMLFGQTASHRVSRFIDEIPPENIERPVTEFRPSPSRFGGDEFDFDFDFDSEGPMQTPASHSTPRSPYGGRSEYGGGRGGYGGGRSAYGSPSRGSTPSRPAPSAARGGGKTSPLQPPTKKQPAPLPDYAVGDHVLHKAFGPGTVVKLTPVGGDALVEILFESAGMKRLMLKAAGRYMTKQP